MTLADQTVLDAHLVVGAIGVRPDSQLARDAGLECAPNGGIIVDRNITTSDPHIYAAGDAVAKHDAVDGSLVLVPLAQTANLQGRRIADRVMGREIGDRPVLGTANVGLFGLKAVTVGWNERRLRAAGCPYGAIHTHPTDHAGYYPGATQTALKLLVDPYTDAILGAQGEGPKGVYKRIDAIATAMTGHVMASDLAELELSYAPPFGSAKDPVMLGFVDENLHTATSLTIQCHQLAQAQGSGAVLFDVRSPAKFAAGAIPGAINIPVDELRQRIDEVRELARGHELIVHCAVGVRGHVACRILAGHDIPARNLDGGYKTWIAGTRAWTKALPPRASQEDRGGGHQRCWWPPPGHWWFRWQLTCGTRRPRRRSRARLPQSVISPPSWVPHRDPLHQRRDGHRGGR